jgi:hypothetical protein
LTNPTSNYGFVLPTATDLVTDLPADFEVALQGVDTRLKALQPGTTLGDIAYSSATANTNTRLAIGTNGQVLGVVGGVPAWTTDASGMTNPMTTTGDTIYSSSGSTPARRAIGTTGQVLTVAGGVPTWATPSAASKSYSLLSTTSLSGSASVTISGLSGYDNLNFILTGVLVGSTSTNIFARFNADTTGPYAAYGNKASLGATYALANYDTVNESQTYLQLGGTGDTATASFVGVLNLSGANTAGKKQFYLNGMNAKGGASGTSVQPRYTSGTYDGTSVISSVTFLTFGSNFTAGSVLIYGAI